MNECYIKEKLTFNKNGECLWSYNCPKCKDYHIGYIPLKIANQIEDSKLDITGLILEKYLSTV